MVAKTFTDITYNNKGKVMKKNITFNDVLISPQYSTIKSRKTIDLSTILAPRLELKTPIISAPMDTVTETEMSNALAEVGGLGIIHRYNSIEDQCNLISKVSENLYAGAAIGVTDKAFERATALVNNGCTILCIDVAHGHHILVKNMVQRLRKTFGNTITIIAGNIATAEAYIDMYEWGVDIARVGVGGGSICSTRVQTGHGIPTLQSVLYIAEAKQTYEYRYDLKMPSILADGGIKTSGDIVKALAAGADAVMLGSMLAGSDESPGEVIGKTSENPIKIYRGMASPEAQIDWRGYTSSEEGISATVPYKGSVIPILDSLKKGITSGLSYSGCSSIKEFQQKAQFLQQSESSKTESGTHILNK